MRSHPLSLPGLGLLLLAGCGDGPRGDQRTGAVTGEDIQRARQRLAPEVRAALDSGSAAYGRGDLDAALARYGEAAARDSGAAAAWFGIYMVQRARGEGAAAQEALRRASSAAPDASLIEEKRKR